MNSHIIKNVADPLSNQDVAKKTYVDEYAITIASGVVFGDIKLNVGSDLVRSLGCNNLTTGKNFTLQLGTNANIPSCSLSDSLLPTPIKIKTDGGFHTLINQQPLCDFGKDVISCSPPINIDSNFINNVKSPVNRLHEINKAYVDLIKYKTDTGIIPNTVTTDHTLFTYPTTKAFASGNR